MELAYRLLNVFTVAGDRLSGNPLCVFEDGRGLGTERMQALARQFSLSETTFVLPPERTEATARVRIFTPDFEMPFAGHPTLGTAHVVRALTGAGDRVGLERVVAQGAQVGRPSRLLLDVDGAGSVFVAGQVVKLGGGTIRV